MSEQRYQSFKEFYPFYLGEHKHPICRYVHFQGSLIALGLLGFFLYKQMYAWIPLCIVQGYAHAWIGHFVFEKNRPATFKYPLYSFMGDWVMMWHLLTFKIRFNGQNDPV
jgi:hypothetical protein